MCYFLGLITDEPLSDDLTKIAKRRNLLVFDLSDDILSEIWFGYGHFVQYGQCSCEIRQGKRSTPAREFLVECSKQRKTMVFLHWGSDDFEAALLSFLQQAKPISITSTDFANSFPHIEEDILYRIE